MATKSRSPSPPPPLNGSTTSANGSAWKTSPVFQSGPPPRLPDEPKPHPKSDVFVGAPLTANSVAKLALGIADNQALTVLCECVATIPMIIFPRINAAHARQPAWNDHLDRLRSVGVELIYGDHVWPLAEPRAAGPRDLPWAAILSALKPYC
jgi:hypothetical protein